MNVPTVWDSTILLATTFLRPSCSAIPFSPPRSHSDREDVCPIQSPSSPPRDPRGCSESGGPRPRLPTTTISPPTNQPNAPLSPPAKRTWISLPSCCPPQIGTTVYQTASAAFSNLDALVAATTEPTDAPIDTTLEKLRKGVVIRSIDPDCGLRRSDVAAGTTTVTDRDANPPAPAQRRDSSEEGEVDSSGGDG